MTNNDELDLTFAKMAIENHNKSKHEELEEIYSNNRMRASENRKKKYSKKNIKKKPIHINKKVMAGLIISGMAATVGITSNHCEQQICNKVIESGIIPEGLSIRDDSISGKIVSYEDDFGNRQTMGGDYFSQLIVEAGQENGYTVDEIAITLDRLGVCHANTVENSTLLGRITEELKQLNEKEKSDGRKI